MADRLALTRSTGPPKAVRPTVPAFLNKLYSMVNDPETDELIRWSDDGESFYVPNQSRLSSEVLPRFFKHNNFASFVRQLNMYGFHKVPQLQQGVLKNETETELWQFTEPNFQRDRSDLLDRIQRKKGNGPGPSSIMDNAGEATPQATDGPAISSSPGPLALTSITGELTAIKRHQNNIANELKALQLSNNQLWQETIAAQERHKKQQDTIERILKFLASVFGNTTAAGSGARSNGRNEHATSESPVARHKPMLLIGDGKTKEKAQSLGTPFGPNRPGPITPDAHRFTEAHTPFDPPSIDIVTPASEEADGQVDSPILPIPSPETPNSQLARRTPPFSYNVYSRSPSPRIDSSSDNNTSNNDLAYRASLASLLNSSSSPQRLLATLSQIPPYPQTGQEAQPMPFSDPAPFNVNDLGGYQLSDYDHQDYNSALDGRELLSTVSTEPLTLPSGHYLESNDQNDLYLPTGDLNDTTNGIQKSYRSIQDVETDVDNVQMNLEAIMESLGLDPSAFDAPASAQDFFSGNPESSNRFDVVQDAVGGDHGLVMNAPEDGNTGGVPLDGEAPAMDIESLINHFNTTTENSFDSSQFSPPDAESIAQRATMMKDAQELAETHKPSGLVTANPLLVPDFADVKTSLERSISPSTKTTRSKRKSDVMESKAPSDANGSIARPEESPPTKKLRTRRKRI